MSDAVNAAERDKDDAPVHDRLRRQILSGAIPPGEISQAALARRLEVGRAPLRDAIKMLQREGLVVPAENRRIIVVELSAADAEGLLMMRVSLEGAAMRVTVPYLGSEGMAELEGLMAQMDYYIRSDDPVGYREPHRAFHFALVAAAGDRVTSTIAQLFDHAERYQTTFGVSNPEIWGERREEHRAIVEAVSRGDLDLAVQRLAEHYGRTATMVFEGLGDNYEPDRLRTVIASVAPGAEHVLAQG